MTATDSTQVTEALDALDASYRLFRHPGPVRSLEQAAEERGHRPEQVVRSIVFRISEDEFVMVLMAGPHQISWRALRRHLGESRLTIASKEELREVTGYEIGAVSPFGLPAPMRVLVDESVLEEEEISLGAGERGATVIMRTDELLRALGDVEVGQFGDSSADDESSP